MNRRDAVRALAAGGILHQTVSACGDPPGVSAARLRAKWVNIVADDFVVDLWHNGKPVPAAKRSLLHEIFGATVERVDVALASGDWLVLHVVHNRLRWNGCKFFGLAGLIAEREVTIVSRNGNEWSSIDDPTDARRFIVEREYLAKRGVKVVPHDVRWDQGAPRLDEACGVAWTGEPIWGDAPSTYLKLRVE
jgi:hypothetical protein